MAKEINAGYEIVKRSRTADGDIVLGYNPNAPDPYVTWKYKNDYGYYHGHYFADEDRAVRDFKKRVREEKTYAR